MANAYQVTVKSFIVLAPDGQVDASQKDEDYLEKLEMLRHGGYLTSRQPAACLSVC
jgi:hypothetical protein